MSYRVISWTIELLFIYILSRACITAVAKDEEKNQSSSMHRYRSAVLSSEQTIGYRELRKLIKARKLKSATKGNKK
jgi:hypothetical protein